MSIYDYKVKAMDGTVKARFAPTKTPEKMDALIAKELEA